MTEVGISAVGIKVPEKVMTNSDFEKIVDTTEEWILTRTGIRERHVMQKDEKLLDLLLVAARTACERGQIDPAKLDFIISSTLSPDRISPAQSFELARELKVNNAFCFDINAACSGLIYALATAESFLKTRAISHGLITAAEQMTRFADYSDRNSCVLFGDASTALVVTNDQPQHRLLYTELGSDPSLANEVTIGGISNLLNDQKADFYFRQNGKVVFKFAVNAIKNLYDSVPRKVGLKPEQINYIIPHQANMRIIESAKENSPGNAEYINVIDRYGNTSSASIGLALEHSWNRFKKGDYVLLIGFGGGLSWGAALLEW